MSISVATPGDLATSNEHSSGPRTVEGKNASRRNALKRGLRARTVFPNDLVELIEKRNSDFVAEFSPRSTQEIILVRDMAVSSVKFEQCASLSIADLIRSTDRAEFCWEHDRREAVEKFASRLAKNPSRIAQGLRRTRQGTDFLVERWTALADIAKKSGQWDDDQRRFAFDLLGVPIELRNTTTVVPDGGDVPALLALVDTEVASLREEQESVLDDMNDAEQAMSMAGMPLEEDAATNRLRRDERRARKDFARARNELYLGRTEQKIEPSRLTPQSKDDRPSLSEAAMNNLVKRSQLPEIMVVEEPETPAVEEPEVEEIEETEEPIAEVAATTPSERPRSRRARKEIEKRARDAARRDARKR